MQSLIADLEVFTVLSLCLAFDPGGSSRDRIRTHCMDKSLKSKPSQQRRQRRAFLPSAEGSGVSWTDKHKKKISERLQTIEISLPVLSSLPSLLLQPGFHGWSMGKNWKVQLVSITGVLCAKDCICDPVVLCTYSLFNCKCSSSFPCIWHCELAFSEDWISPPRQSAKHCVFFTNNSLVLGPRTLRWGTWSYVCSQGLWEIHKSW